MSLAGYWASELGLTNMLYSQAWQLWAFDIMRTIEIPLMCTPANACMRAMCCAARAFHGLFHHCLQCVMPCVVIAQAAHLLKFVRLWKHGYAGTWVLAAGAASLKIWLAWIFTSPSSNANTCCLCAAGPRKIALPLRSWGPLYTYAWECNKVSSCPDLVPCPPAASQEEECAWI